MCVRFFVKNQDPKIESSVTHEKIKKILCLKILKFIQSRDF
jgi:hypothetical protein